MAKLKLSEIATRAPKEFDKEETKQKTIDIKKKLNELQNLLYAESRHSILVVLQGMDASGKDGAIRDVFSSMNPQGIMVKSFKVPTEEELSHDFLWRIHQHTPAKGMIQIFNRSHYEDVLVTRVHKIIDDGTAKKRMKAINEFESMLHVHNNTSILKFYLHISKEEQEERLNERLENPSKMWKYNAKDREDAKLFDHFHVYFEEVLEKCNQPEWIIVPADQNWYKEYVIANSLYELLKSLNMKYPKPKT
jgi:PPK2 family polyphosphate:nucleotide phosphotransferase